MTTEMVALFVAGFAGLFIGERLTLWRWRSSPPRRTQLRERVRAEWIAGADEEWRRRAGRPVTAEEARRVLRRYPGDV